MQNKIYGILGLAQRAGKVRSGEFSAEKSLKEGRCRLLLLPEDASDNTRKKFHNMSDFRRVPIREYGTKEELGHALGKEERSSVSIEDEGFAEAVISILDGGNVNGR